jgi:hypothetical protein
MLRGCLIKGMLKFYFCLLFVTHYSMKKCSSLVYKQTRTIMELHLLFSLILLATLGSVISYPSHPEGLASIEEKGLGPILKGNAS